jgi:hypothetical protein
MACNAMNAKQIIEPIFYAETTVISSETNIDRILCVAHRRGTMVHVVSARFSN